MNQAKVRFKRTTSTPQRFDFRVRRAIDEFRKDPFEAQSKVLFAVCAIVAIATVLIVP